MRIPFQSVLITVTCANISKLLFELNARGIHLHHLQQFDELTASFCIQQHRCQQALSIIQCTGGNIESCIPASGSLLVKGFLRRPVLIFAGILIFVLTLYLPTRVLFVTVEGNERIPQKQILEAAAECGIQFGAVRHEIRSEKVKNRLLSVLPELKWVGVNTKGCVACISVRERAIQTTDSSESMITSIVASRDGVIREMTVVSGNPVCRVGQAVVKGQLLVSGYSDCGRCIYGTRADAEIYAQTSRSLSATMVTEGLQRADENDSTRKYGLIIGKKRINFYKGSGISDTTCVRMYMEYPLTLPGGFRLPFILTVQEQTDHYAEVLDIEDQVSGEVLKQCTQDYLESQMLAGRVKQGSYQITKADGAVYLTGQYICDEVIGQIRSEEIIEHYEQTG